MAQHSKTGYVSSEAVLTALATGKPGTLRHQRTFDGQRTAIPRTSYSRMHVLFALA